MKLYAIIGVLSALILSPCAIGEVIYTHEEPVQTSKWVHEVKYEGVGWRNTRSLITTSSMISSSGRSMPWRQTTVHYVCGRKAYFQPTEVSVLRDEGDTRYTGVPQGQRTLDVGFVGELEAGYFGAAKVTEQSLGRLMSSLTRICSTPPSIVDEPDDLTVAHAAGGSRSISRILPSRFRRNGDIVRYWLEAQPTTKQKILVHFGTEQPVEFEEVLPSASEGLTLRQEEIACSAQQQRIIRVTVYRPDGTVLRSTDYGEDTAKNPFEETVPNSIGEATVLAACLLQ